MKLAFGLLFLICLSSPCCLHAENGAGQAQGRTGVDEGLRQAIERTTYGLDVSGPGSYAGANPAQRLDLDFNAGGAWLRAGDPAADAGLRLTGYGYGTHLRTPGPATLTAAGTRAEYQRAGICEWYRNTSRGLEQGFTLTQRPGSGQEAEPLVIAVEVRGGLRPVLSAAGDAVLLQSGERTLLRYAGLEVRDDRGHIVPSHLDVRGRAIRLVVQDSNAEYPLVVDPLVSWYQQAELAPSDTAGSYFGQSVSVSGNMAVVGAPSKAVNSNYWQGAAYVFVESGGVWTQQAELTAADGAPLDSFGWSVSLSGNTILVGATDPEGRENSKGAAYVFVKSAGVWTQQAKLTDGGSVNDSFGYSVSLSGNTAVVGAPFPPYGPVGGAAYVFVESGGVWTRRAKLTPADYIPHENDYFGSAVSVNGSTLLIGAPGKVVDSDVKGAAYVFVNNGGTWSQQAELTAADGLVHDEFGDSVSLSGNTILVGAPVKSVNPNDDKGAAYVFVESGGVWTQQAKLIDPNGARYELFGYSVSLSGDTILVGAPEETVNSDRDQGAAYVFVESGGVWTLQRKLTAGDGAAGDWFGDAVSLDGSTALVGVALALKAYVYLASPPPVNPSFEQGSSSPVSFTGLLGGGTSAATGWYIWNNVSGTTTTELCTAVSCPSGSVPPAPLDGANTLHVTTTSAASGVYQIFPATNITGASLWLKVVRGTVLVELLGPGNRMAMTTAGTGVLWLPAKGVYNEIAIYSLASGNTEFYADDVILTNAYPVVANPSFEQGSSSSVSFTGLLGGGTSAATGWYIWNNVSGTTTTELCTAASCPSGSVPPTPFDGAKTLHVTTTSALSGVYQVFPATNLTGAFFWLKVVRGTVWVELLRPGNRVVMTTAGTGVLWLPANGVYNEIVIYSLTSGNTEFYADDVIPE